MFRYIMTILLTLAISACAPQSTPTTIIESTQAPQISIPSEWAGTLTYADGTSESSEIATLPWSRHLHLHAGASVRCLRQHSTNSRSQ